MDTVNYIEMIKKCNRNREKIELPKSEYKTVYGDNVKGVIFRDKFYSKSEYDDIRKQENDTVEKRIAEINKLIEQEKT